MTARTGYPDRLSNRTVERITELKARKGHLCAGGDWWDNEGPICGCGVGLHTLPDLVPPSGTDPDNDAPPWDTDPQAAADQLEDRGKSLTETRDGYPDMNPAVPPIDPTAPYGPAEVEAAILDAVARLERGLKHEANLIAVCDQLKLEYDLAYARAIEQSTGGAADVRKANAVLACERQYRAYMEGCAARDAMKAVTHTLRATLSGLQSVGRSVGVAYQAPQGRGR